MLSAIFDNHAKIERLHLSSRTVTRHRTDGDLFGQGFNLVLRQRFSFNCPPAVIGQSISAAGVTVTRTLADDR